LNACAIREEHVRHRASLRRKPQGANFARLTLSAAIGFFVAGCGRGCSSSRSRMMLGNLLPGHPSLEAVRVASYRGIPSGRGTAGRDHGFGHRGHGWAARSRWHKGCPTACPRELGVDLASRQPPREEVLNDAMFRLTQAGDVTVALMWHTTPVPGPSISMHAPACCQGCGHAGSSRLARHSLWGYAVRAPG
jgi:hypothetical protein